MSLCRRSSRVPQLLLAASLLGALLAPPAAATSARHSPSGGTDGAGGGLTLRVATYNIHAGAGMDGVFDLDRQTAELRSLDADVIGLQEVDRHWGSRSEWRDLAGELARRLRMYVSFAPIYSLDPAEPGRPRAEYGVAVLSRHRIVSAENHRDHPPLDPGPEPGARARPGVRRGRRTGTGAAGARVRDPPRLPPGPRRPRRPGRRHPPDHGRGPGPEDPARRPQRRARRPRTRPALAGSGGRGSDAPTFPAQDPVKRIDFVAVSKDRAGVRRAWVPESLASDHRAVVADLLLRRR